MRIVLSHLSLTGLVLAATSCSDVAGPQQFRGVGERDHSFPTEVSRLNNLGMVLDVSFRGPCGVGRWDVQAVQEGQTVEVTPFFDAVPTGDRCASTFRYIEPFVFIAGDSARFVIIAEPEQGPGRPAELALDTVVPFHHVAAGPGGILGPVTGRGGTRPQDS